MAGAVATYRVRCREGGRASKREAHGAEEGKEREEV